MHIAVFVRPKHKRYSDGMKTNQKGIAHLLLVVGMVLIAAIAGVGYMVATKDKEESAPQNASSSNSNKPVSKEASSSCPDPVLQSPVDITKVKSVLYPGQTRGGNYKAHGGFHMEPMSNNKAEVKAPMDAKLVSGSRYIELGEQQILLYFQSACGVNFRFDHLLELTPKMQAMVDTLPEAKQDDSRTTNFDKQISVKAGELIATAVGFPKIQNTGFDFGVYDTRKQNETSKDPAFQAAHAGLVQGEQLKYGVCWFDYFSKSDAAALRALPATDQKSGKTSDYCN